jgi:hypothetical protein
MPKPLGGDEFKGLQRRAEDAFGARQPDQLRALQAELETTIRELNSVVLRIRTQPWRGDPEPTADAREAQMQITVLREWLAKITDSM